MTKQRLIILRGYPGSGKTTIGKSLFERGVGTLIDHNSILTFLADIVGDDNGIYDEIHILEKAMARKLLKDKKNVIVARGFSSSESIFPYISVARDLGAELFIFKLSVSESNLRIRVVSEERKKGFNPTVNEDALMAWVIENPLETVDGEYEVNADKSIEKVVSQILSALSS